MVPNIDGTMSHAIKTRKHPRHGTQCVIQYPTNRNPAQSLQENAITVSGPRLYSSLPKYLRDIESVKTEKFKFELDKFMELIPTSFWSSSGVSCKCPPIRPWSSHSSFETTPSIQVSKYIPKNKAWY